MLLSRTREAIGQPRVAEATGPSLLEEEVAGLFDQYRVPLLRYLYSFGLPMQDGEEVVQEVFLALFQHLRRGKPRTNLQGWVFRVAHNLGLKRCQARRREGLGDVSDAADAAWPDAEPNPEEQAAARERHKHLLAVVEALPELDRRCLYLRAEGLRYREIRDVLGMSLGAVSLSLERSLERLSRVNAR